MTHLLFLAVITIAIYTGAYMKDKTIKKVLTLTDLDTDISPERVIGLYEQLIVSDDIDEDLDRTHVMYSFCVILGEEFNHAANIVEAELGKWAGMKWQKLKSSVNRSYTDNDAKRKIESSSHYLKEKIRISKYRKLHRQLAFGGGKALELKVSNLKQKIYRVHRALNEDFNVREEELEDRVKKSVKSKLKRR